MILGIIHQTVMFSFILFENWMTRRNKFENLETISIHLCDISDLSSVEDLFAEFYNQLTWEIPVRGFQSIHVLVMPCQQENPR